jgi:hypothetical protein
MSPQVNSVPSDLIATIANHPKCKILESRSQYRSCHINVPAETAALPAVQFEGRYYSFLKLIKDRTKTLQTAARLVYRGNQIVITTTVKGDVLWCHEPEAAIATPQTSKLWVMLESDRDYVLCQIRVPDVTSVLTAIHYNHQYFALLRTVREVAQAIDLAERLSRKGHATVITKQDRPSGEATWAIWVLETEVSLYA